MKHELISILESIGNTAAHRQLVEAVSAGYRAIFEGATSKLYHFATFDKFCRIFGQNRLYLNFNEQQYNGKGIGFMSFSRTPNIREGFPTLLYGNDWGRSDDWCLIRINFDGDQLNQINRFKSGGKYHTVNIAPFDWVNHAYGDSIADVHNLDSEDERPDTGKTWMLHSTNTDSSKLPVGKYNGQLYEIDDKENHPYSQAEDRLTTTGKSIPNAVKYITGVDIIINPSAFTIDNFNNRARMKSMVTRNPFLKTHAKFYLTRHDFEHGRNMEMSEALRMLTPELAGGKKNKVENYSPDSLLSAMDNRKPALVSQIFAMPYAEKIIANLVNNLIDTATNDTYWQYSSLIKITSIIHAMECHVFDDKCRHIAAAVFSPRTLEKINALLLDCTPRCSDPFPINKFADADRPNASLSDIMRASGMDSDCGIMRQIIRSGGIDFISDMLDNICSSYQAGYHNSAELKNVSRIILGSVVEMLDNDDVVDPEAIFQILSSPLIKDRSMLNMVGENGDCTEWSNKIGKYIDSKYGTLHRGDACSFGF